MTKRRIIAHSEISKKSHESSCELFRSSCRYVCICWNNTPDEKLNKTKILFIYLHSVLE